MTYDLRRSCKIKQSVFDTIAYDSMWPKVNLNYKTNINKQDCASTKLQSPIDTNNSNFYFYEIYRIKVTIAVGDFNRSYELSAGLNLWEYSLHKNIKTKTLDSGKLYNF